MRVVVCSGGPIAPTAAGIGWSGEFIVVAADSGFDRARALGLRVDLVVGDFDSLSDEARGELERMGAAVERHAVAKDATDLELALDAALRFGPAEIRVVGSSNGRVDQAFGELLLIAHPKYAGVPIDLVTEDALVHVVRGSRTFAGVPGATISLFPVHGDATGVTTEGLLYPLTDETLVLGATRGVSNEFAAEHVEIAVAGGVLIAVRPL